MKFIGDDETGRWLRDFVPDAENFEWDAGNKTKNVKHGVRPEEVESIFYRKFIFAGKIVEPAHDEWRGLLLGEGDTRRPLALIFTRRGDRPSPDLMPAYARE